MRKIPKKYTRKALRASIKYWKKIIGRGKGWDDEDRPMCILFSKFTTIRYEDYEEFSCRENCNGCYIKTLTGFDFCKNTPIEKWILHQYKVHSPKFENGIIQNIDEIYSWIELGLRIKCEECDKLSKDVLNYYKQLLNKL